MKQKEERFKCVALTTVGGWISMIVAFLVGLYLASRGKRTSACDGNLLLCTELRRGEDVNTRVSWREGNRSYFAGQQNLVKILILRIMFLLMRL